MKPILYFKMAGCPYCREADRFLEELKGENPAYRDIPMQVVFEEREPELAGQYDYYYVPTFYVDGVKRHEGALTRQKLKAVLDEALG